MQHLVGGYLGFLEPSRAPFDDDNALQHREDAQVIVSRGTQLARPAERTVGLRCAQSPDVKIGLAEKPLQRKLLFRSLRRLGQLFQLPEAGGQVPDRLLIGRTLK